MAKPQSVAEFGWPGGDAPGELQFRNEVDEALTTAIVRAVGPRLGLDSVGELRALVPPRGAVGRYRLAIGGQAWFVRVSADWGEPALEQSLTAWLRQHGVMVNHLEWAGIPLEYGGQRHRLDLRELIVGRHFDDRLEDLGSLAESLGRCHRVLATFPEAKRVQELSKLRFERLAEASRWMQTAWREKRWNAFSGDDWAEQNADWLAGLFAEYTPRFDQTPDAQCLHSQVHRANVVYRLSGEPVLVDFEEAVHTFAPVSWDLAYFVQRFCLHDLPSEGLLRERVRVVREAYGRPLSGLVEMMRQTAWFSAVILAHGYERGIINPRAEYDKFVCLEKQAREWSELLETEGNR